jgi:hypothetical protein
MPEALSWSRFGVFEAKNEMVGRRLEPDAFRSSERHALNPLF